MPVNKTQRVLLADLILCQNVNPSQELLSLNLEITGLVEIP